MRTRSDETLVLPVGVRVDARLRADVSAAFLLLVAVVAPAMLAALALLL